MRLICDVEVVNRLLPSLNLRGKKRSSRASIAVGASKNGKGVSHQIQLITAENKGGVFYNVGNLQEIFAKFINDGKATLRLSEPPHDILVKADPIQLKGFVKIVQALRDSKAVGPSALSTLTCNGEHKTLTKTKLKMHITSQKDYPLTSSFPSTLQVLHVNSCNLHRFDSRILRLKHLRILNLSDNSIPNLPPLLTVLPHLCELHVARNKLTELPKDFLLENLLPSLVLLNLSDNLLSKLPQRIGMITSLVTLKLDGNSLTQLPDSLGLLSQLKILTVSKNNLAALPGSIINLRLDYIDIDQNPFECDAVVNSNETSRGISLMEISANAVLKHKIPFKDDDLPRDLILFLRQSTKCCCCKNFCFENCYRGTRTFDVRRISETVIYNQGGDYSSVPLEAKLCSRKCHATFKRSF